MRGPEWILILFLRASRHIARRVLIRWNTDSHENRSGHSGQDTQGRVAGERSYFMYSNTTPLPPVPPLLVVP